MKPSEEMNAQADRIESGGYRWVHRCPSVEHEACLVAWEKGRSRDDGTLICDFLGNNTDRYLTCAVKNRLVNDEYYSAIHWNDHQCSGADEAVAVLRAAAALAESEGQ